MSTTDLHSEENLKSFKSSASLILKVREEAGEKVISDFQSWSWRTRLTLPGSACVMGAATLGLVGVEVIFFK